MLSAVRSFMRNRLDGYSCIYGAFLLLLLPLRWTVAAVVAAGFHELCHYAAVRLCGGRVLKLKAHLHGASMEAGGLSSLQEIICILSGPAGSLALLFFAPWFPRIAVCGAMQGLFNLLPVGSLDGGRALRCLIETAFPVALANRLCIILERVCLLGLVCLGVYGSMVLRLGLFPLIFAIYMCYRAISGQLVRNSF